MDAAPKLPRVRFVDHNGKRILLHDFSNVQNREEALALVAQAKVVSAAHEPRSLLTVADVHGSRFDKDIVEALTDLVRHNKPFVRHGAIIGLSGLQRVLYVALTQLTGRKLRTFEKLPEALDWLVEQE